MTTAPTSTAKIIDTIIALDTIMPALLDIIVRQDSSQREALNAALTYAIYRLNSDGLKAAMKGVVDVLGAWKEHITVRPKTVQA